MAQRKLVIIGAGSAYTPEIIDEVIRRQQRLNISEIALVDILEGKERAKVILGMTRRMLSYAGVSCQVTLTLDRRKALPGADFVISQIRFGGWKARAEDERICLSLGLISQETTGCGGFMNAMRTIPEALAIAQDMEKLCPNAILLNFTNPSGIVTEMLLRYSSIRTIGLCNVPINMQSDAASALGVEKNEISCSFGGLNHLSFMLSAKLNGSDVYPKLVEKLRSDPTKMNNIPKVAGTDRLISTIGLIPSPYLQYYYFEPEMLEKEFLELNEDNTTRGDKVEAINIELFKTYAREDLTVKPPKLSERGGALYSYAAMDILEACLSDKPREMTIITLNEGIIEGLEPYGSVEITCLVSRNGVERLPIGKLPKQVSGLIEMVKRYESLTVDAAISKSRRLALQALLSHPLIHGFCNAERVLEEMKTREHCPIVWEEP